MADLNGAASYMMATFLRNELCCKAGEELSLLLAKGNEHFE